MSVGAGVNAAGTLAERNGGNHLQRGSVNVGEIAGPFVGDIDAEVGRSEDFCAGPAIA